MTSKCRFFSHRGSAVHQNKEVRPFKTSAVDKTVSSKKMQNELSEVNAVYLYSFIFLSFISAILEVER